MASVRGRLLLAKIRSVCSKTGCQILPKLSTLFSSWTWQRRRCYAFGSRGFFVNFDKKHSTLPWDFVFTKLTKAKRKELKKTRKNHLIYLIERYERTT